MMPRILIFVELGRKNKKCNVGFSPTLNTRTQHPTSLALMGISTNVCLQKQNRKKLSRKKQLKRTIEWKNPPENYKYG